MSASFFHSHSHALSCTHTHTHTHTPACIEASSCAVESPSFEEVSLMYGQLGIQAIDEAVHLVSVAD